MLNDVFKQMKEWKCDVEGALERFLDDEEMYMDFLHQIAEEEAIVKLGKAIDAGDIQLAFDYAHTLKRRSWKYGADAAVSSGYRNRGAPERRNL